LRRLDLQARMSKRDLNYAMTASFAQHLAQRSTPSRLLSYLIIARAFSIVESLPILALVHFALVR